MHIDHVGNCCDHLCQAFTDRERPTDLNLISRMLILDR